MSIRTIPKKAYCFLCTVKKVQQKAAGQRNVRQLLVQAKFYALTFSGCASWSQPWWASRYCPFAGRRDGKNFVYSHEQIMQKYQKNMRMVDRIPEALSGAMGNQMYVATFSTREGMEQFYSDVLAVTDENNAAVQKELSSILALGEPETAPAPKAESKLAAKPARTAKKK